MIKMAKIDTLFMTKTADNHTHEGRDIIAHIQVDFDIFFNVFFDDPLKLCFYIL